MSKMRGMAAMKRVNQKLDERRKNRPTGTWQFMLDPGDEAIVRFRGLLYSPPTVYTKEELEDFTVEDLVLLACDLQATYREEMSQEEVIESILARQDTIEPKPIAQHFIRRNMGKRSQGLLPMLVCGDSEVALLGEDEAGHSSDCRYCFARNTGDKSIGFPAPTFVFTLWDYTVQHQIVQKDGSKSYVKCTMEEDEYCKHCEFNESAPDGRQRKRLKKGLRVAEMSEANAKLIGEVARRVSKKCRSCGLGNIKCDTTYCTACEEEIPLKDLLEAEWRPDSPEMVQCPHCAEVVMPLQEITCTKCDEPERTRLCDVTVLAKRVDKKTWSFSEQLPAAPLDPEDELDAEILGRAMPDLDEQYSPPDVAYQLKQMGYEDDPMDPNPEGPGAREEEEEEPKPKKKNKVFGKKKGKKGSLFGKRRSA